MTAKMQPQDPNNQQAERSVLGSILIDPDAIAVIREIGLQAEDFYHAGYATIFRAMLDLNDSLQPIDCVTLCDRLETRTLSTGKTELEVLGGAEAISRLVTDTVTSCHARYYAEIVKRLSRQRQVISMAGKIAAQAYQHEGDTDELYNQIEQVFFSEIKVSTNKSHLYGDDQQIVDYLENQKRRAEMLAKNPEAFIKTGFADLDRILGRLLPGQLHVVVARPSVGKTMYMEMVAEYNAKRGHKVAYYHLELPHQRMLDRRMSRYSGIPGYRLEEGYVGKEIDQAIDAILPWKQNIVYIHCPGWGAERIATDIQQLVAKQQCNLAIVDYLQKMALPQRGGGLNAAMLYGLMAETLKTTAEICGIPIILGSQVSRDFKTTEDKRPHMESIRNSGEIEEKANQIVVLHRPEERDETAPTELIEASVEKNESGNIGRVNLLHIKGRLLLGSIERQARK